MQNTKKGFNYSVLAAVILTLAFFTQFIESLSNLEFPKIAIAVAVLLSFLLAIIGGIYLVIGIREESSKEQIIGFIITSIFLMIITYFIILLCNYVIIF